MTEATQRTSDNGVSIWLDDLSRSRIESGSLQDLIANKNVVGVTTNPSIFQKALSQVGPYDAQLKELGKVDVETAVRELTTTDVRNATDIFREIAEATDFVDGRVSIEVDPRLAHETEATEDVYKRQVWQPAGMDTVFSPSNVSMDRSWPSTAQLIGT